jgi:hypothetical protein
MPKVKAELVVAICLSFFPFGWDMLDLPHLKVVGIASWLACLAVIVYWITRSVWFMTVRDKSPFASGIVFGCMVTMFLCVFIGACLYKMRPVYKFEYNKDAKLAVVDGRSFVNETVPIDGYKYINCTFTNVTFRYNGTTPPEFMNDRFVGSVWISTGNDAVAATMAVLKGLGLSSNIPLLHGEQRTPMPVEPPRQQ